MGKRQVCFPAFSMVETCVWQSLHVYHVNFILQKKSLKKYYPKNIRKIINIQHLKLLIYFSAHERSSCQNYNRQLK